MNSIMLWLHMTEFEEKQKINLLYHKITKNKIKL